MAKNLVILKKIKIKLEACRNDMSSPEIQQDKLIRASA